MKDLKMLQKNAERYDAAVGACKQFLTLGIALLFAAGLFMTAGCQTTYTISGTVSGAIAEGVTVTLSGAGSETATTDSDGYYSFTGLSNGSYTVTPSLSGYLFSPSSAAVTIADADVTGTDFESVENTTMYTISGTVSGEIAEGVTVTLSGAGSASAITDSAGEYSFTVTNGSYTVTPTLSGYSFSPSGTNVTVSTADVTGVDFTSSAGSSSTLGDRTDYSSVTLTPSSALSLTSSDSYQYYAITSSTSDKPGFKAASGDYTVSNSKIIKTGDTANRENSGFYGFNSGVLATSSSSDSKYSDSGDSVLITMTDCTITTDSSGSNGAFAFGQDAVVTLDHVTITTTGSDNSRGVDATYGGTVNISNSVISTQGGSCAALATDRYERYEAPKINAANCTGTTAGTGSPGIYCTGTFTVTDCTLNATGSEAAVIEGLNSITLENTSITGAKKWGVMIYQSMSGDSSTGTGTFKMTGGALTNNSTGPAFFICNTTAVINLDGATINNSSGTLLKATTAAAADDPNVNSSWGTKGGTVTFTAKNQKLEGNIVMMESSSSIDLTLSNGSTLSGAINTDDNAGDATLTLDSTSSWVVTGTSYLSKLTNADTGNSNITGSGKVYVAGVQVH